MTTIKVLLTIPFRAIIGSVVLFFGGIALLICMSLKAICFPKEPVFDYMYRSDDYEHAINVSLLNMIKRWWMWIFFGAPD